MPDTGSLAKTAGIGTWQALFRRALNIGRAWWLFARSRKQTVQDGWQPG